MPPTSEGSSGVADDALGVHDAHPHDAGLVGHVDHHFVEAVAVILEHVVRGAAAQHLALLLGADEGGGFQVLLVQPDAEVTQQREHHQHSDKDATPSAWR